LAAHGDCRLRIRAHHWKSIGSEQITNQATVHTPNSFTHLSFQPSASDFSNRAEWSQYFASLQLLPKFITCSSRRSPLLSYTFCTIYLKPFELKYPCHTFCSAQTRTRIGHLRKPPGVELIPAVESHLGVRAPYETRRKRRYEANKCGWTQHLFCKALDSGVN
jgi:hypothetical protein